LFDILPDTHHLAAVVKLTVIPHIKTHGDTVLETHSVEGFHTSRAVRRDIRMMNWHSLLL
jgi:hypothetical protein